MRGGRAHARRAAGGAGDVRAPAETGAGAAGGDDQKLFISEEVRAAAWAECCERCQYDI
jgi:hypothetical protein